jgi:hypothetical protein
MKSVVAIVAIAVISASVAACGSSSETKLEKEMHSSAKSFGSALERQKRVSQELKGQGCPKEDGGHWEEESKTELLRAAKEFKPDAICHLRQYEETAAQLEASLRHRQQRGEP